ncbi:hypothetical protein Q5530_13215 [Saccharothrix sp. BKS2]|uniref:hypothetical protein n=1 Tax=Saccharothrix sp. BKS2 TaxID=3064400 RepID=UPI0039ED6C24
MFCSVKNRAIALAVAILFLLSSLAPASAKSLAWTGESPSLTSTFSVESLGGVWPGQKPAVIAKNGRLDIFMKGFDQQLYHYWQGPGQSFRLESLGGSFSSYAGVSATSGADGYRDVFAVGTDKRLHHYWQRPGEAYFRHEVLGGGPWSETSPVEAVSWGAGRWDVFVEQIDYGSHLYHYWYPHHEPSGPTAGLEYLGHLGASASAISATTWPDRLDVFVSLPTGCVRHYWQNSGEPFHVECLLPNYGGGQLSVVAVSGYPGRLDVFAPTFYAAANAISIDHFWQNPGSGGWGREGTTLPAAVCRVEMDAATWGQQRLDYFTVYQASCLGGTFNLNHHWQEDAPFQNESLDGSWPGGFSSASWGPRRLDVFTIGHNRELYHHWQG